MVINNFLMSTELNLNCSAKFPTCQGPCIQADKALIHKIFQVFPIGKDSSRYLVQANVKLFLSDFQKWLRRH